MSISADMGLQAQMATWCARLGYPSLAAPRISRLPDVGSGRTTSSQCAAGADPVLPLRPLEAFKAESTVHAAVI